MAERNWKLGDDLSLEDDIIDPVTFDDIVISVRCNAKRIDKEAVKKAWDEIMELRFEDAEYLLENNIEEIIEEVKRQKGMI